MSGFFHKFAGILILGSLFGCPQKSQPEVVDFERAIKFEPIYDMAQRMLTIKVNLAEGYHAYAPGEKIGVPVSFTIDADNGWKTIGEVKLPQGKEIDLGPLGKSVVLTGVFSLQASVDGGHGQISGTLNAQICTDRLCDKPRKHKFSIPAGRKLSNE